MQQKQRKLPAARAFALCGGRRRVPARPGPPLPRAHRAGKAGGRSYSAVCQDAQAWMEEGIVDMLLERQEKEGLSMLFITHDIDLARWIGDDVAILYAGHLVEAGDADEVLKHPAHPYTKALIAGHPAKHGPRPQEGCPYAPSCPYAQASCSETMPTERELEKEHRLSCMLF